jgi:hypothetical protein
MRPLIWISLGAYVIAMLGVRYAAHGIVDNYGLPGTAISLAAIYGFAVWFERRYG